MLADPEIGDVEARQSYAFLAVLGPRKILE